MDVQCHRLVPQPLAESPLIAQGIWGGELSVAAGERVLVTSPSGRGKTTLLHILYGIRRDYRGTVLLDATDIRSLDGEGWLRVRRTQLALVFQDLRLFDSSTVHDAIEMVRVLTGVVSHRQVRDMAGELGVLDHFDTPCAILSSGQRQRVALIRALARPFTLLLLDEPFSHLDAAAARTAAAVITQLQQQNAASVIVTGLGDDCPLPVTRSYSL
jgi:ABC-type lipoprotein export system ATPase subunit